MGGQCKWAIRFDNKTGKWPSYGPAASLSTGEREGRKNKIKTWRKGKVVSSFFFYQLDKSKFTSSIAPDIQIIHDHLQCVRSPQKTSALIWPCRSHKNRRASLFLSLLARFFFYFLYFYFPRPKSVPVERRRHEISITSPQFRLVTDKSHYSERLVSFLVVGDPMYSGSGSTAGLRELLASRMGR